MIRHGIVYEKYIKDFNNYLKSVGSRHSEHRDLIVYILFSSTKHLSPEKIKGIMESEYRQKVGIATVYRILRHLESLNLVDSLKLRDSKVYELNFSTHHDHIVCLACGKIEEFRNSNIEKLQEEEAGKAGFEITSYTMTIYGLCKECRK